MKKHIDFLAELASKDGPTEQEWGTVDKWIEEVSSDIKNQMFTEEEFSTFNSFFGKCLPSKTMYGLSYHKPHGYPGDYEIIDKIFTHYICPEKEYSKWDHYYQQRGSARAVRKRKEYFKKILQEKVIQYPSGFKVLNIASGPCRDILEFLEENPTVNVKFSCIETDPKAIDYAKKLLGKHLNKVEFIHTNIFKHKTEETYDLIWSSGLYDYFNDAAFLGVTKKLIKWSNPQGEIVVGNFAKTSPDVYYMHIVNWILYYRSPEDLIALAKACGIDSSNVTTYVGDEKVSLIFHMKVPQSKEL